MKPGVAKAKGRTTENLLVEYLRSEGLPYVERRRLTGSSDQGDIAGWPGVCVEVKSAATWQPMRWLDELDHEAENARAATGFVAARPKGKPHPSDWVAIMRLPLLLDLMRSAGWIPDTDANGDTVDEALKQMRADGLRTRAEKERIEAADAVNPVALANVEHGFRGAPMSTGEPAKWTTP